MQGKIKLPSDELIEKREIKLPSHEFTVKGEASLIVSHTEPPTIILRSKFSCQHWVLSTRYTAETKLPDEVSAMLFADKKLFSVWVNTMERAIAYSAIIPDQLNIAATTALAMTMVAASNNHSLPHINLSKEIDTHLGDFKRCLKDNLGVKRPGNIQGGKRVHKESERRLILARQAVKELRKKGFSERQISCRLILGACEYMKRDMSGFSILKKNRVLELVRNVSAQDEEAFKGLLKRRKTTLKDFKGRAPEVRSNNL